MGETQRLRAFDALFCLAIMIGMANFVYHAIEGDYGVFAILASEAEVQALTAELEEARRERAEIENRVARLGEGFLDLDLLEETARDVLGLMNADEVALR